MMNRAALATAVVVLLVVGVAAAWWLRPAGEHIARTVVPLQVEADCDSAQRSCRLQADAVEFELSLGPPVRSMETFAVVVRQLRGEIGADALIEVQFQMRDMDMGLNRYRLNRDVDGVWRGQAMLPVCNAGRSDWIAQVTVSSNAKVWQAQLPFVAGAQ